MRNFNIVRMDGKGRLLVPYHIRELMDLEDGDEFVIVSNHNGEIKMMPLVKGRSAEIDMRIGDSPGNLARITEMLAKFNVSIIMSQMRVVEKGHLAEWHALVDTSEAKDFKKLLKELNGSKIVKSVNITEKE